MVMPAAVACDHLIVSIARDRPICDGRHDGAGDLFPLCSTNDAQAVKKEKAMTNRATLQTSTRLAGLLVAAAIVLAAPYAASAAVRSGIFCVVPALALASSS